VLLLAVYLKPNGQALFWPAVGACVGAYLFYRGFKMLQRKRLIQNTPSSKVRSAAMGLVEITGLATGPYTMPAPITGLPCYYYRTMAWRWERRGKSSEWVKVADESRNLPFYLDDSTGRVLVDPNGAEMDIHRDFHEEYNSLFSSTLEVSAPVCGFLARHAVSIDNKIKIEEYCIKPKNALFILGTLAENPGIAVNASPRRTTPAGTHTLSLNLQSALSAAAAGSDSPIAGVGFTRNLTLAISKNESAAEEVIRLSPQAPTNSADMTAQGKIAAAMMKAGIVNPAAWEAAGLKLPGAQSATISAATLEEFDLNPKTVLMKGTHDPAFFISWHSQKDVVRALAWKSALMIWGGPLLTLACVYILALELNWL
jgi:hypothetical protein